MAVVRAANTGVSAIIDPYGRITDSLGLDRTGVLDAKLPRPLPRTLYPTGSRNDQRNRSYWNLDLRAAREFQLKGGVNLGLTAEIFNVLNDGTYIIYNQALKSGRRLNGADEAYRRYGSQFQLGFRLAF